MTGVMTAASSAASFVQSIGVVGHISTTGLHGDVATLTSELSYLGVTTVRAGAPNAALLPTYTALAHAGIKFDLLEVNVYDPGQNGAANAVSDVANAHQLALAAPGSIISFEGVNEYTSSNFTLNGVSSLNNLSWGLSDASALQAAVRADPLLSKIPVIAPSAVQLDSLPNFSAFVNASNAHVYGGVGAQLQDSIVHSIAYAQASAPGMPTYITETGISSSGYGTSTWGVTDQKTQAVIDTNAVLDGFKAGAAKTILYELMDEPTAINVQEQHFGLFNADGTPKPAATAIGDLTHILADDGKGTAPLKALATTITGLPATASTMLLEKSNGVYDLVVWNGRATLYDGTSDVTPPASHVTLSLDTQAASLTVYDPVVSAAAQQTVANASSIGFALSADPVVVEIKFPAAASTGGAGAAPSTPSVTAASVASPTTLTTAASTTTTPTTAAAAAAPTGTPPAVSDVHFTQPVFGKTVLSLATVTGVAAPGDVVTVKDGATVLGQATANANGAWSLVSSVSNASQHVLTETAGASATPSAGETLFGKSNQTLVGSTHDDVLIGAPGDVLTGGGGADHFVLHAGAGKETITDFAPSAGDLIYVDHSLASSFSQLLSMSKQSGSGVVVAFDKADVLTIAHANLSSLNAGEFVFV